MAKYVGKRLVYMVVVFFVISFIMYMLYNLIPGDPAAIELQTIRDEISADDYEEMYQQVRDRLGLDDPIVIRYFRWLGLYPSVEGKMDGVCGKYHRGTAAEYPVFEYFCHNPCTGHNDSPGNFLRSEEKQPF